MFFKKANNREMVREGGLPLGNAALQTLEFRFLSSPKLSMACEKAPYPGHYPTGNRRVFSLSGSLVMHKERI